jgi:hypothetical protein
VNGWLILIGYFLVGNVFAWRFAVWSLDWHIRESPNDVKWAADNWRGYCLLTGVLVGLIWPVSLPLHVAYRLVVGSTLLKTPAEREHEQRMQIERQAAEIEQLKRWAQSERLPTTGLDLPGDGR